MEDMVGSTSKSRLTKKSLDRIEIRTSQILTEAMMKTLDEMGPDAKVPSGDYGNMYLLARQTALLEEQVVDIKVIKERMEV